MAIKIQSTNEIGNDGIKALVYGDAGIGKTCLMATAPRPIILSCESGLLSLGELEIPYIEIDSVQDIYDAFEYLTETDAGDKFDTICLDSISEIGEVFLAALKKEYKDARQAYTILADELGALIRKFRDIKGKNILFSAKEVRITDDDTGITTYMASMPGKNLLNGLPFFFDEVFYMTKMQGDEGETYRVLKTQTDFGFRAKDRSGKLNYIEEPDLSKIISKINGEKHASK